MEKDNIKKFYINEHGLKVFTAEFLASRGKCCSSNCYHCPYDNQDPRKLKQQYIVGNEYSNSNK